MVGTQTLMQVVVQRKIVGIVQLTDPSEYEGGDVQFGIQDKDTKEWYYDEQTKRFINIISGISMS